MNLELTSSIIILSTQFKTTSTTI